jgi:hypothetical protein
MARRLVWMHIIDSTLSASCPIPFLPLFGSDSVAALSPFFLLLLLRRC